MIRAFVIAIAACWFTATANACTVPPIGWQPPRHGAMWCGQWWDRGYCRYGCLPRQR